MSRRSSIAFLSLVTTLTGLACTDPHPVSLRQRAPQLFETNLPIITSKGSATSKDPKKLAVAPTEITLPFNHKTYGEYYAARVITEYKNDVYAYDFLMGPNTEINILDPSSGRPTPTISAANPNGGILISDNVPVPDQGKARSRFLPIPKDEPWATCQTVTAGAESCCIGIRQHNASACGNDCQSSYCVLVYLIGGDRAWAKDPKNQNYEVKRNDSRVQACGTNLPIAGHMTPDDENWVYNMVREAHQRGIGTN